jgi:hypothetical protein
LAWLFWPESLRDRWFSELLLIVDLRDLTRWFDPAWPKSGAQIVCRRFCRA